MSKIASLFSDVSADFMPFHEISARGARLTQLEKWRLARKFSRLKL